MESSPVTTGLALLCAVLGVALWSVTSKSQGGPDGASTKRNQPTSKNKKKKSNQKSISPKQEGVEQSAQSVKESAEKERAPIDEKRVKKEKGKKSAVTTAANKVDTANGLDTAPQQDESLELSLAKKALSLHDMAHTNGSATPPSLVPSQVIASEPVPASENGTKKRKPKTKNGAAKTNDERRAEIDAHRSAGERDLGADMLDRDMEPETTYTRVATIPAPVPHSTPRAVPAEDGWQSVGGKLKAPSKPAQLSRSFENPDSNAWASSNPFAALPGSGAELPSSGRATGPSTNGHAKATSSSLSTGPVRSVPGHSHVGTDAPTKKQRQNAAKAAAKKTAKANEEAERQARLNQHKKELEAERMREFYKKGGSGIPQPSSKWETVGQPKQLPKASINERGSLVWD